MFGICGILGYSTAEDLTGVIRAMTTTLLHRGSDDVGVFVSNPVAFGHTRLSIIDLSPTGHQPMLTPDESVARNGY